LLVMPYACSMVGGRPLLTPASEQSHRIVGQREQRTHTACSPVNREQCRNWTVHRFMLDCEGSRVPWVSVVASVAEETTRRAWIEDGRLVVRMPASWSFEPGDPCARQPGFDDRFGFGRMRRYCADRRAMAPPPIVEMPAGFAPLLGIEGIFVKSTGPSASPPPPLPPPVASAPPALPPKVARNEPPPPARAEPTPLPAARPEPPSDTPAPSAPPPKVAVQSSPQTAPAAPAVKAPPAPTPAAAPPIAVPSGPVIPKIINRPESATTEVAEQKRTTPTRAAPPATEIPKSTGNPIPSSGEIQPPSGSIGRDDTTLTVSLLSIVRSPTIGIVALGGLALALLAAFALARRRERLVGTPPARDIASVSLEGKRGRSHIVPRPVPTPPRPSAVAPLPSRPPPPPAHAPAAQRAAPAWVDRIPQTRVEALQILGVGVSPDATETAMKKVVDGLRLSWHPDLAKDEADRQLREFRLKQINAAWDLIQGKRLERLDS
jgi:hypothetical protein